MLRVDVGAKLIPSNFWALLIDIHVLIEVRRSAYRNMYRLHIQPEVCILVLGPKFDSIVATKECR